MSTYYVTPNTFRNGLYSGNCYAFGASGGFTVQQGFNEILLNKPDLLQKYNVQDAIQLQFSVRTLNEKISILKDASNFNVVEAWFDPISEKLHYDSLKICACEFIDGVNLSSIFSVGRLSTLYSDFKYTVGAYFGDPGGFASLFSMVNEFDINNGVFDASAFLQVINSSTFKMNGSFVSDLSGYVTISDINNTLDWVVDSNVFRNRNPALHNYGIIDGFVAGDLVFIPEGFTISLSVDIEPETLLPINNVGPSFLNAIRDKLNWTKGYVQRKTTYSTTNITQTTTVPILLVLTDTSVQNYTNFASVWDVSSNLTLSGSPIANQEWLAISLSTTGKYQTAITASGDIYISDSFGLSRDIAFNIGSAQSNTVSISFTGMHQTASNGHSIYVSNDFGQTWKQTYTAGTSNVYVNMSLNGQYQTLVSCGDTVYTSRDYGMTWTPITDVNSDIYNSVEAFPTAGVALSYNGLYQTIVTENIYISSDFGQTWTNVSYQNDFDDRNWQSVAMSSDGIYQTAIENGGDIYRSSDYGNTWAFVNDPTVINKTWSHIAVSATGQYQTALEQNGGIYRSIDYGVTWTLVTDQTVTGSNNWEWIAISSDALYQCAVVNGGQIYMSKVFNYVINRHPCICD